MEPVPKKLRILTINHHESFISALAPLGHEFDIVTRKGPLDLSWNVSARQPPANFRLIDFDEARKGLSDKRYDLIICHTIKNLSWFLPFRFQKTIFVAHIPLYWASPSTFIKSTLKLGSLILYRWLRGLKFIAVSQWKRETWGQNSRVACFYPIPFPPQWMAPQKARHLVPVTVGNLIRERGNELGWDILEELLKSFPIRVLGKNPGIPQATRAENFPNFVNLFTECHFYIYTIRQPQGDGYNTAMLEAMLQGMPVVTIANPTSPIIHGVNGLVAQSVEEMKTHIKTLLDNPKLIAQLGAEAKKTVEAKFSADRFLKEWQEVIDEALLS